jgi:gamma-glutamyltranspeptidase/glutathione hydrolase
MFRLLVFLLLGCVTGVDHQSDSDLVKRFAPANQNRSAEDYQALSRSGMVVAAHPLASEAGAKMLEVGGNAVDAAVAASFVIAVVRPQSSGIGGGGFLLHHDAATSRQRVFDFRERAPRKADRRLYIDKSGAPRETRYQRKVIKNPSVNGHLSVAIPGLVRGLVDLHKELGKLDLHTVMAPSVKIAMEGFRVYDALAKEIEERQEWLGLYPGSRKIFFDERGPLKSGAILEQRDLAATLKEIAATGGKSFYEGAIAKKIIAEMERGQGVMDLYDLRNYRMIERAPLKGSYRGRRIVSMPPPSSGGTHVIEMLNMLETRDLSALHPRGATYIHLLAEVMRRAFADRAKEMGDPDFTTVPVARLTSKSYAKERLKNFDPEKATASNAVGQIQPTAESPSTTHISVIDRWGNAVATTQTVNYSFGSTVVAEGTGIVLNDEMDDFTTVPGGLNVFGLLTGVKNDIEPGKTPLSSMSPTMVFGADGRVDLVLGSPGGPRIINAVLQTIVNVIDFKMLPLDAVHATRIHHQYIPDELRVESDSLDTDTRKTLEAMGHLLKPISSIGDIQAIVQQPDGLLVGISDSRSDGKPFTIKNSMP